MSGNKRTLQDLAKLSTEELEQIYQSGKTPDAEKLVGWEFKGYNIPFMAKLMGIKKFKKGFYKKGDEVWGYNIPIQQNAVEEPWNCKPSNESPKRFGFYSVNVCKPEGEHNKEPGALILNYADGKNWLWEGSFLRDYIKQVDADNDDLYLGKAYTQLGPAEFMPMFFIIERDRKSPGEVKR
jgi:hypothetical protein